MAWLDTLVEQPFVASHHVVHRAGVHVLWCPSVIDDERAATDRLCHMGIDLAVRVHRAGYIAAAMRTEQHAVLCAVLRRRPHGRNSAGIGFDVIDAVRLAGNPLPL